MELGIQGMRVLVTAGASGIGLEVARAFVREGAKVHVCDVDREALDAMANSDPQITRTVADVSDRARVALLFEEALKALGGLDVLINNAGIAGPTGRVEEIPPEEWDHCLAVDLTGQFNCVRLAVPHLRKSQNASIINLSSVAGRIGGAGRNVHYAASKGAVNIMTVGLAREVAGEGIRVNAVAPGLIDTESQQPGRVAEVGPTVPMKRAGRPDEVAQTVLWLATDEASYVTGALIDVSGGR